MDNNFEVAHIAELRAGMAKFKRQVQAGQKRIIVASHGRIVGFLLPITDFEGDSLIPVENTEEISVSEFRNSISNAWDSLQSDIDCFYLTFHKRRVMAFLSPRLVKYLPLPIVSENVLAFDLKN